MGDIKQIDEARMILGLGEEASIEEIKSAYRELALKYHPDRCVDKEKGACEEMFKKVNNAYGILMVYCANYRFSFREEEVRKTDLDEKIQDHMKRFYDGWWGDSTP
jgi:preprotein translocase subunit Sec63